MKDRVTKTLEHLEFGLAPTFAQSVSAMLRRLTDAEINRLFLETHTGPNMGDDCHPWMAVLLPLIDAEAELRRELEVVPYIGPIVAPELYRKGGGHDLPF